MGSEDNRSDSFWKKVPLVALSTHLVNAGGLS